MDVTDPMHVRAVLGELAPTNVIHTAAMTNVDACETDRAACWAQNTRPRSRFWPAECAALDMPPHPRLHRLHLRRRSRALRRSRRAPARSTTTARASWPPRPPCRPRAGAGPSCARCSCTARPTTTAAPTSCSGCATHCAPARPLKVVDDQWRTPTLAEDLADGCLRVAEQNAAGIFNISSDELLTPYQMAQQRRRFLWPRPGIAGARHRRHLHPARPPSAPHGPRPSPRPAASWVTCPTRSRKAFGW